MYHNRENCPKIREIGEVVRYLGDQKKTKFRLSLKLPLLLGWRPKSAMASPKHLAHNVPNFTKVRPVRF